MSVLVFLFPHLFLNTISWVLLWINSSLTFFKINPSSSPAGWFECCTSVPDRATPCFGAPSYSNPPALLKRHNGYSTIAPADLVPPRIEFLNLGKMKQVWLQISDSEPPSQAISGILAAFLGKISTCRCQQSVFAVKLSSTSPFYHSSLWSRRRLDLVLVWFFLPNTNKLRRKYTQSIFIAYLGF